MAEKPVCTILTESERAGVHIVLERPLTRSDLIRVSRVISHLAESRSTLCPEVKGPEVLSEPDKSTFCSMLKSGIDAVVGEAVRMGRIERPDEFTAIIYWADRLSKEYACPR